jgi:hypothetical protein
MATPTTLEAVKVWLRLTDDNDNDVAQAATDAANAYVVSLPIWRGLVNNGGEPIVPANVTQGATMLAARLYRRRNSPGGIEAFADAAVYVGRTDPDVSRLLQLDHYAPPRVG